MQSGTALGDYAISRDTKEMSFKLGENLGVKTADSAELVKKLTEFTAKQLVDATMEIDKNMVNFLLIILTRIRKIISTIILLKV